MSVVNLNKARKERARSKAKARADANAVKFGRTKAKKRADKADTEKAAAKIDHHKRER